MIGVVQGDTRRLDYGSCRLGMLDAAGIASDKGLTKGSSRWARFLIMLRIAADCRGIFRNKSAKRL